MKITTLKWVPPFVQGFVKDHRIRWACEEAEIPYELRLVDFEEKSSPAYRLEQPFSQVPVLEDGDVNIFESGAIALYIAEKSEFLLPKDLIGRARAITWVFAALNSIEPFVQAFNNVADSHPTEAWTLERYPVVLASLRKRLDLLSDWLKQKEYLENRFTIGDLMMSTVLRDLMGMGVLEDYQNLLKFRERCEARPAFQRALAAQMKTFADHAPAT